MSTDDDEFREAVKDVKPIKVAARVVPAVPPPPPVPVQTLNDEAAALAATLSDEFEGDITLEVGEELAYRRNGIPPDVLRKLRRGDWALQDHLDLHGLTVDQARELLATFLNQSVKRGIRCIRIVHGKGYRSANGEPVLKRKVAIWLGQRDEVLAYVQARPEDGGGGAVMVLLRGHKRP